MNEPLPDVAEIAQELGALLELRGQEYAFGGAIALGYWGEPRGTIDVDLTLFVPPDKTTACIRLLQELGFEFQTGEARTSLEEHGFCQVRYRGVRVDVFLPTLPFYETARTRRRRVALGETSILVWDPEVLIVFKMMFFRRKDVADVEQILRTQGANLDRDWVRARLTELYGGRDPRLSQWDEVSAETAE